MPGGVAAARRRRELRTRRFRAALEPIERALDPDARTVLAVDDRWRPVVFVLDEAGGATLLRARDALIGDELVELRVWPRNDVVLEARLDAGWRVALHGAGLALRGPGEALEGVRVVTGRDPHGGDRAATHALAAALERAAGPAPARAPALSVDRVGAASPDERVLLACVAAAGLALAAARATALLDAAWAGAAWAAPGALLVAGAAALAGLAALLRGELRPRDGRVELYEDRVVAACDRLVVAAWSDVRGYDDRREGWVELRTRPPVAIPTPDEETRTTVLAFLDARGLRRTA